MYFSPLRDEKIPADVDGLIFYGGYPELYAEKLSRNSSMRDSVHMAVKEGLPCIGECGGFLYLQEYLETKEGQRFPMTGVLPGGSHYTGRLLRFGYVTLSGGTAFGGDAGEIPAHEFHYYDSTDAGNAYLASKPLSKRSWRCIVSTGRLWGGLSAHSLWRKPEVCRKLSGCMQEQEEGALNQETDLEQVIRQIRPLDEHAMEQAKKQWNSIAKPLHSLGKLEEHIIRIAGITGDPDVKIEEKALIVMCADNGVVEEGVTQTGQEVTAIVAENFLSGETSAAIMCKKAGARILPIDIGMAGKIKRCRTIRWPAVPGILQRSLP